MIPVELIADDWRRRIFFRVLIILKHTADVFHNILKSWKIWRNCSAPHSVLFLAQKVLAALMISSSMAGLYFYTSYVEKKVRTAWRSSSSRNLSPHTNKTDTTQELMATPPVYTVVWPKKMSGDLSSSETLNVRCQRCRAACSTLNLFILTAVWYMCHGATLPSVKGEKCSLLPVAS